MHKYSLSYLVFFNMVSFRSSRHLSRCSLQQCQRSGMFTAHLSTFLLNCCYPSIECAICSDARKTIFAVSIAEWESVLNSVGIGDCCCSKHPKQALVQALHSGCSKFFLKTILTSEIDFVFERSPEVNYFSLVDLVVGFITSILLAEIPPDKGFWKWNAV